jgi:2,4'-dihydroxyacetophenone dioxygenase
MISGEDMPAASLDHPIDSSKIVYQLPHPMGMIPACLIAGALALDGDERDWVPQPQWVWFKPLLLSVSQGYYINILRVRASGVLSMMSPDTSPS